MPPGIVLKPEDDENFIEGCPYPELVCAMVFIARYTRPDVLFHARNLSVSVLDKIYQSTMETSH